MPIGIGRRFVSFKQAKIDIKNNTLNNRIIPGMKEVRCFSGIRCYSKTLIGDKNDVKLGDICCLIYGVYTK